MPARRRRSSEYPPSYGDFIRDAFTSDETITLGPMTRGEALSRRTDLYRYRNAVATELEQMLNQERIDSDLMSLSDACASLFIKIEETPEGHVVKLTKHPMETIQVRRGDTIIRPATNK